MNYVNGYSVLIGEQVTYVFIMIMVARSGFEGFPEG
jgi:hypothetical protein